VDRDLRSVRIDPTGAVKSRRSFGDALENVHNLGDLRRFAAQGTCSAIVRSRWEEVGGAELRRANPWPNGSNAGGGVGPFPKRPTWSITINHHGVGQARQDRFQSLEKRDFEIRQILDILSGEQK